MDSEISLERQREFFGSLTEPMPPEAIEWRVQTAGQNDRGVWAKVVPYADARWLMQRLDDVFGPMGWWDEYSPGPGGGILCTLTVTVDGFTVSKQDVAGNTEIESIKGGVTDAFKRACVKLNVGNIRALYGCGELFAVISESGQHYQGKDRNGKYPAFKWDPPRGFRLPESTAYAPATADAPDEDEAPAPKTTTNGTGTPLTKETRQQIENLFRPVEEMLSKSEKKAVVDALNDTEERGKKALSFLEDRIAALNAPTGA